MRTKKTIINVIANIIVQLSSIVIGLLVPRLIISHYGSSVNGLIQMMTQIISYFGIVEGGVAVAAGASLYKPLLKKDTKKINNIMTAVRDFYFKTGIIICIVSIIICVFYPLTIINEIRYSTSFIIILLLLIISVSGYLIFNKYNMILVTDQKHYITLISSAISNILVALIQIIFIINEFNIILVVVPVPLFGMLRLLFLRMYVQKHYNYLTYNSNEPDNKAISQKWNALSLNVSQICKIVIPLVVLSNMFDLKVVSVYTVYSMVFRVGSSLIETIGNSITATFGNILAENEKNVFRVYNILEIIIVIFITIISVCFYLLINPFISVYIGNNSEISYYCPVLALSFVINEAIINMRFTPKMMLKAKGDLKGVSKVAIFEIIITLILTPIFCKLLGFEFVLFGSIISGLIQTIYMTLYVYGELLKVNVFNLLKKILLGFIVFLICLVLGKYFYIVSSVNIIHWGIDASIITFFVSIITIAVFGLFYTKDINSIIYQIKNIFKKRRVD